MPNESDSGPVTINQLPTLREINERNRKFWEEHSSLAAPHTESAPSASLQLVLMKFRKRPSDSPTRQEIYAPTDVARENETPERYLATHELTRKLTRLGVTSEQLRAMRFRGTNQGWPFDQWSVWSSGTTPAKAIPLLKSYCALKWLILENPPYSRDKEDAWRIVSETMAAPIFMIGLKTKEAQRNKAQKPRGRITDDGRTIGQVIEELAVSPEYQSVIAKELWPHLFAVLDKERLDPKDIGDSKNPQTWAYEYDSTDGRKRRTSFGRFKNIVSKVRKGKKSRYPG